MDKLIFANILTMDRENPICQAVGIKDGKIAFLGTEKEGKELVEAAKEVWEIKDRTVLPGFIDTHVHGFLSAPLMAGCDLSGCKNVKEVTDALTTFAKTVTQGRWVFGSHFQDKFMSEGRFPTLAELDAVSDHHPVAVAHNDFHPLMLNSYALGVLGLDGHKELVMTDQDGMCTGIINDIDTMTVLNQIVAQFSSDELLQCFREIEKHGQENGFTTICIKEDLANLKLVIENRDKYGIYLKPMVVIDGPETVKEVLVHPVLKEETCICLFTDGAFDAHTAAVYEPYEGDPENYGILFNSNKDLYRLLKTVHDAGLQFSCHAIGDRAIGQVLDTAERILRESPREDHRHRIEHFEMPTKGQIMKAAKLSMALGMQPLLIEVCEGMDMSGYRPYVGDRVVRCSPYRSILDQNILVGGGSDFMVTDMLALRAAQVLLTHPVEAERIDRYQCLEMYTTEAAKVAFLENRKGAIKLGMDADLVVLDRDPYRTEKDKLSQITIEMTIYNGEIVYECI